MDQHMINSILKRRTFAIISHPDAGKTTLTEKFLLFGGAIREAGSVKSRKSNKYAVSDWMEIEKQRGISVTSSVLQFYYNDYCVNILDTPGHQDFSEDTYRTLMAADTAIMVIDSAKGIETQTKKLFKVTNMRGLPVFTFVNKLDRRGKSPFEILDELEHTLGIKAYAMNWPVGSGSDFKGVYHRQNKTMDIYTSSGQTQLSGESIQQYLSEKEYQKLLEDLELLDIAGYHYNHDAVLAGQLSLVFFGSALNNFGVQPLLESFLTLSPPPTARMSNHGAIAPTDSQFTGFVFKIQANMNPAHRDRIAFIRICSGKFIKGMQVHLSSSNKTVRLAQPQQFMAQDRVIVEEAYAGDIIGVHDPGIFHIGDTLSDHATELFYEPIPSFSPEHFAKVYTKNSMKRKQFIKGIHQLAEEGTIQVFKRPNVGVEELIIGVVGVLQFDILAFRLENEYRVEIAIEPLQYQYIRWIASDSYQPDKLAMTMDTLLVEDHEQHPVLLFQNQWSIQQLENKNKGIQLMELSNRL